MKDGLNLCHHGDDATFCKECFKEVFDSYLGYFVKMIPPKELDDKMGPVENNIHSPEFLRET